MRSFVAVIALAFCGCWYEQVRVASPPPPAKVEFRSFKSQPWQVVVVDLDAFLPAQSVTRARAAVEAELRAAGVVVQDEASSHLRFEVTRASADPGGLQQCVTVTAQTERTAQAFLPSQPQTATRCSGPGSPGQKGDPVSAVLMAGATASKNAGGGEERARTEALFSALHVVLTLVGASP
ncbi:MAG: hypothetical protein IT380_18425 [Myxococcales bacterium]|nr:hypothetical protein [Myxococcales bacterium]